MTFEELVALGGAWAWANYGKNVVVTIGKDLVSQTGEKAKRFVGLGWNRVEWLSAAKKYRKKIQELYGTIHVLGMAEPVPLEGIFTDVLLLDRPSALNRFDINQLRTDPDQLSRVGKRVDGLTIVLQPSSKRLFVLGKPGAGKTTFLKYLTLQATNGTLDKIPIFVSLKEWADSKLDLMSFLASQFKICNFPDALPFVEHVLEKGDAIVLFDGLDEVNQEDQQRDKMIAALRNFSNQYSNAQCLITCRIAATEYEFEHFTYVELADFTEAQIRNFAAKWFSHEQAKLELFEKTFVAPENKGLRELAKVPLLLSLLCLSFGETMSFPQRRVEIYEEALEALLKKWDASRSIKRDDIYKGLSLGRKRQMLTRVAAQSFQMNEYLMQQEQLSKRIISYLRQLPEAPNEYEIDGVAVLKAIEAQHGILIERAHRIYSFSHLTLQEYFTAKYITDHASSGVLQELLCVNYITDPRWREVILLTSSMLENADQFFRIFQKSLRQMIEGDLVISHFLEQAKSLRETIEEYDSSSKDYGFREHILKTFDKETAVGLLYCYATLSIRYTSDGRIQGKYFFLNEYVSTYLNRLFEDLSTVLKLNFKFPDFEALRRNDKSTYTHSSDSRSNTFGPYVSKEFYEGYALDINLIYLLLIVDKLVEVSHDKPRDPHPLIDMIYSYLRTVNTLITSQRDEEFIQDWRGFTVMFDPYYCVGMVDVIHGLIVKHRGFGHVWHITDARSDTLKGFFYASLLLLECLRLAAVTDRKAIEEGLLWNPSKTTHL